MIYHNDLKNIFTMNVFIYSSSIVVKYEATIPSMQQHVHLTFWHHQNTQWWSVQIVFLVHVGYRLQKILNEPCYINMFHSTFPWLVILLWFIYFNVPYHWCISVYFHSTLMYYCILPWYIDVLLYTSMVHWCIIVYFHGTLIYHTVPQYINVPWYINLVQKYGGILMHKIQWS